MNSLHGSFVRAMHLSPKDDTVRPAYADELDGIARTEPCRTCDGKGVGTCPKCRGRGWFYDDNGKLGQYIRNQIACWAETPPKHQVRLVGELLGGVRVYYEHGSEVDRTVRIVSFYPVPLYPYRVDGYN